MKNLNKSNQSGYTLIEVMIAGTLGLVILIGVMQIYLGTAQTNRLQAGVRDVQDSGRFILTYLEKDIQRAGWVNLDPGIDMSTLDTHIDFENTTNGTRAENNFSDSITITYEPDTTGTTQDCDGTEIGSGERIINTYAVSDSGNLTCNGQTIIENVETMQILYGVENSANELDGIIDGYVTAASIGANAALVVTVRIGILIRSANDVLDVGVANTNKYQILDNTFDARNDRKLRRVYIKTIVLPNRPQSSNF